RIYPVETDARRQYGGELVFDNLTVKEPLSAPPLPPVGGGESKLWTAGSLSADRWRFAVLSGQSISADEPEQALEGVKRQLQEALKAGPEFLLIGRGFTATYSERDLSLARQVITEQVGDRVPVLWLGGDQRVVDVQSTRFVLLDTLTGALHTAGFDQWLSLRDALDQAAADPAVRQVVVVGDRTPARLGDYREGQMLQQWLTEFGAASGKPVAYLAAPGGGLGARWTEGVPYLESLTTGGLTLFGIADSPAAGEPWIMGTTN
ncbi:MAG TPA: hypothetical protein VD902_04380, partial [Symbiobacteriaceae bacterium]|nr:hypothetical protein [Symbiobacteriaceae bacterium]